MPDPLLGQVRQWEAPWLQLGAVERSAIPCSVVLGWPPCFEQQTAAWEKVCGGLGIAWVRVQLGSGSCACPACGVPPGNLAWNTDRPLLQVTAAGLSILQTAPQCW